MAGGSELLQVPRIVQQVHMERVVAVVVAAALVQRVVAVLSLCPICLMVMQLQR